MAVTVLFSLQHFLCAFQRRFSDVRTADDARQLCLSALQIKRLHSRKGPPVALPLGDEQVGIGKRRDLWQMGHAQDLLAQRHLMQLLRNALRRPAGNTGVHLVKNQRRHMVFLCQHILERQHDARQLAAGSDLVQGFERFTKVGGHIKCHCICADR